MSEAATTTPIDPLRPSLDGAYTDELVEVRAQGTVPPRRALHMVRTEHFDVHSDGDRLHVRHRVPPEKVDDDLAGLLADELFAAGWLRGPELFERIFTGTVLTSGVDALDSWELFYRNTLARIESCVDETTAGGHGTIAGYAPVYARAESLLAPGSVLELGCCFGFLSLRIAASGRRTTASDLSSGTTRLLAEVAPRLGVSLSTLPADAGHFPAASRCADTVLAIHLLEHLDADHGDRVLAEALRLAARRVVVAVPLEEEADETWGHVRTISLDDLTGWGERTGLPFEVSEHHGGWLVIETS
ncbi:mycofactocin oligosaccharide methyltransferase MftM [Nocardioides currus]|uniref:Class I SAM-dependent methyltransferase n=1 Tax=Nocardioides currus TaxID=2133958 RepID=A0A2R7YZ18_9ACTN|nr:mycofactocin oligosaccharide methyltransferase MftM [Nocardioides currus]PUA81620.1 class I SAM-dependent methyltransferase [Nocardioides currus]